MYPHERSLVKKFANKPFAILGVNSCPRKTLARVQKEKDLTWRSFWDGGNTSGPIASRWNVSGWPTIYLIDAQGVIRYKNVRGDALDEAIDKLMNEVESPR